MPDGRGLMTIDELKAKRTGRHIYRAWVEGEDVNEDAPFYEGKAGGWHDAAHRAGLKLEAEGDVTDGCVVVIVRSDGVRQSRVLERVITFNSRPVT